MPRTLHPAPDGLAGVMFARLCPRPGRITQADVCCDLVWRGERLYLSGPQSEARPSQSVGQDIQVLNLDPVVAQAWLGIPLSELRDRQAPLAEIAPHAAGPLEELFHAGEAASLVRPEGVSAAFVLDRRASVAAQVLRRSGSVRRAAESVGLSERQLERLFGERFGLPPKRYATILRMRRAVALAKDGASLAGAAVEAGYGDQAHFNRDVRILSGRTPLTLLPHVGDFQYVRARTRDY
ncbi:helix-turn-helix domain-containing protein [Phenylobacterium sp.]|uniref:helix-turn-helix domain-containing protein n=1 Tax=Phenylobacterium sp. TaxID=1871053 RepID=UPI0025F02712|nr:helix-turn-helix domain-containing protein [Phenylobacterium sp.]MBX3482235.1 AraC family transcriptional regulator [Phenylobacterium sp.]MCW5758415.1 AraC family transcriptional regulator [Phenylobacterium sp.]